MPRFPIAGLFAFAAIGAASPALACTAPVPLNLAAARNADVVVIGRVSGYRGGRDAPAFNVAVEELLSGRAARTLRVRFAPGLSGAPPSAMRGRVLLALRRSPPAGGLTVLQGICSPPFVLDAASPRARTVRALLARRR